MKPNFSFSPDDFKKWMEHEKQEHHIEQTNNLIGVFVESKISEKRLVARMEPKEGKIQELASDFKAKGGVINDVLDQKFLIEVDNGFFYIPRFLVKKSTPSS